MKSVCVRQTETKKKKTAPSHILFIVFVPLFSSSLFFLFSDYMIIFLHTPVQVRLVCVDGGPPPLLWLWDLFIPFLFSEPKKKQTEENRRETSVCVVCPVVSLSSTSIRIVIVCCVFL